jgi:hypothetical protein
VWADGLLASAHSWPSRCDIALVQPGAGRITGIPASRARVLALEEPYRAPRGAFPVERQPEGWHPVSQESLASGAPRTSRPRHRRDVRPSRIQPGRCHIAPELAPPDVPGASLLRAGPCKAMPVPARQCRSLQGNLERRHPRRPRYPPRRTRAHDPPASLAGHMGPAGSAPAAPRRSRAPPATGCDPESGGPAADYARIPGPGCVCRVPGPEMHEPTPGGWDVTAASRA